MAVKPIPEGFHTVTPYLAVNDTKGLFDFMQRGVGATEKYLMRGPDGTIVHGEVMIGDSPVMFGQARTPAEATQAMLYVYVPDADAAYKKAVAAGATSISEPATQFYGDRHGAVRDCCGNQWWFSTHVEDVPPEELERRSRAARQQHG